MENLKKVRVKAVFFREKKKMSKMAPRALFIIFRGKVKMFLPPWIPGAKLATDISGFFAAGFWALLGNSRFPRKLPP